MKIKFSMTCVSKEYEIKTMVQGAMTIAKNEVFIWLKLENCYLVGQRFFQAFFTTVTQW